MGKKTIPPPPDQIVRVTRALEASECQTRAQRVEYCCQLMRDDKWVRGKTAPELMSVWGLALSSVEHMSAEASRRVLAEIQDPERLMRTGLTKLETIIDDSLTDAKTEEGAAQAHQHRKVASDAIAKLLTLAGAAAPQKVVLELEKLSDEEVERRYQEAQRKLLGTGETDE